MPRPKRAVLEYRSYELPAGFPLIVLTGNEWIISSTPSSRLHFHNCLEIGICHSGSGTMLFNHLPVEFGPGSITCVGRNIPHTTWSKPDDPSLWSYLFLDPELLLGPDVFRQLALPSQGQSFLNNCHIVLSANEAPWGESLTRGIISEQTLQEAGYQFSMRGYCMALLIQLLRAYYSGQFAENARRENTHVISPALDYIRKQYNQCFDQKHLADRCREPFRRIPRHDVDYLKSCCLHLLVVRRHEKEIAVTAVYDRTERNVKLSLAERLIAFLVRLDSVVHGKNFFDLVFVKK